MAVEHHETNIDDDETAGMVEEGDGSNQGDVAAAASNGAPAETFVNSGLKRWEEVRSNWLGRDPNEKRLKGHASRWATDVNVDEVIDLIFSNRWRTGVANTGGGASTGTTGNKKDGYFPSPVPLPQMVDILVDLWEAEGLEI